MSRQLKIDFEWIPRDFGDPVDRASLARIMIEVGGRSATDVEDLRAKTIRSDIRVSAFDLASWLVANWWRLRWEADGGRPDDRDASWDMSHRIGAIGNGYLWPDMEFSGGDGGVHVRGRPTDVGSTHALRFLNEIDVHVPADDFESAVREFVDAVVSRMRCLNGADARANELEAAWRELDEEIRDPERGFARAMEARMGFDPEEAAPALLNRLREAATLLGANAIGELAVSSKRNTIGDLDLIQERFAELPTMLSLDIAPKTRDAAIAARAGGGRPWARAETTAGMARREWRLGAGPIGDDRLAELCDVSAEWIANFSDGDRVPIPAGLRVHEAPMSFRAILKKRHPNARRFALARIIGDHLTMADGESLLPVTDAATDRQRFQRAFAQAFLCPFDALREFLDDDYVDDDLTEKAALHFGVSEFAIRSTLADKGVPTSSG